MHIYPQKKYSSTSTHWFSNTFIQNLYSQTKNNIQYENDGSNLNKMSKNLHFQTKAAHRRYASQVTAGSTRSLERETKSNQVDSPCIGFSRALINIWYFLQSLFFVHGQWELLFLKWWGGAIINNRANISVVMMSQKVFSALFIC